MPPIPPKETAVIQPAHKRLKAVLADEKQRAKCYHAGRVRAGLDSNGRQRPACAATASEYLIAAKIIKPGEAKTWTADLIAVLLKKKWTKVAHPKDVLPSDLVVTMDLNGNGAPDHVVFALSRCDLSTSHFKFTALDNKNRGKPYLRNAGKGSYTPMSYALRCPVLA